MDESASFCPKCGSAQGAPNQYQYQRPVQQIDPNDSDSIGWAILGFLFPLVGLILFLVWSSNRPKSAKMAGMGALISVIFGIVFTIILVIVYAFLLSSWTITTSLI